MMRVGITGGIGSGKSLVCRALQSFGVPVFYADSEVKQMYDSDEEVRRLLVAAFGEEAYAGGKVNARRLAQLAFADSGRLAALNAIAHPALARRYAAWAERQEAAYTVIEAALLFEADIQRLLDKVATVSAPEALRVARVAQRDGCPPSEALRRMAHQLTDGQRSALADITIVNDNATPLLPQILRLHEALSAAAL
ncbi:MAG: dephospho-CoA kinase [Prevotellaceae bacterium]|jgi:dephospho-CoA kinase|nr:dephospho-CoA kinase [Prevotellaceae bacterium]